MEYLTQELTETTFSREEELTFASCDVRKKMKLSTMLSMMASIAGYDYDARGLTYEVLRDMAPGVFAGPDHAESPPPAGKQGHPQGDHLGKRSAGRAYAPLLRSQRP